MLRNDIICESQTKNSRVLLENQHHRQKSQSSPPLEGGEATALCNTASPIPYAILERLLRYGVQFYHFSPKIIHFFTRLLRRKCDVRTF